LDGQGGDYGQNGAVLTSVNTDSAAISITGNGITITGFGSITGGSTGISVSRGGQALITKNTIENNDGTGISVTEGGSARIGFSSVNDPPGAGNIIQNNGGQSCTTAAGRARCRGITLSRAGSAVIVGNKVLGNLGSGVSVSRVSQADIAGNIIDSNGLDAIEISSNSGVSLGNNTGNTQFDLPNTTTANNNNAEFGIRCTSNSFADGRLSTGTIPPLSGASGPTSFAATCVNSLIP
jgi:hypothetical protein